MTTLANKLQETTKRLQQLTVWRPSERDPYYELDRWRAESHAVIDEIYQRKRQQIEQLIEKHEKEFMRHLARQRLVLSGIRDRLFPKPNAPIFVRTQTETSILADLHKVENDINAKLGRAEIIVQTKPIDLEESVAVALKTYLPGSSSMFCVEMPTRNQSRKLVHRSPHEIERAFEDWKQKKNMEITNQIKSNKSKTENRHDIYVRREEAEMVHKNWLKEKNDHLALNKKSKTTNNHHLREITSDA